MQGACLDLGRDGPDPETRRLGHHPGETRDSRPVGGDPEVAALGDRDDLQEGQGGHHVCKENNVATVSYRVESQGAQIFDVVQT